MLTLSKRPQPVLGATPASRQYTEDEYALAMRQGAIREGHMKARPKHDHEFIEAIQDGCHTTASIANYVETSQHNAYNRLQRMEKLGMIKRDGSFNLQWSLK